jgi:hypothetical protein
MRWTSADVALSDQVHGESFDRANDKDFPVSQERDQMPLVSSAPIDRRILAGTSANIPSCLSPSITPSEWGALLT